MWWDRILSKRLGIAITGIVTVAQAGLAPLETAVSIATIVVTYIAAETARPSGSTNGND
jgi:hypothetical protein